MKAGLVPMAQDFKITNSNYYKMKFVLTFITFITFLEKISLINEIDEEDILSRQPVDENKLESYDKTEAREFRKIPCCNEDQLMFYLAEIQVINPENIMNLATLGNISYSCKKIYDSLCKVDKYLQRCEPPTQSDLYMQLLKGLNALYRKLCSNGPFISKYEVHCSCYHDLHNDYEECAGPADWAEDKRVIRVCKTYKDITNCFYVKTARLCGKEAADTMKELILCVLNNVLVVRCDEVRAIPKVKEVMPRTATSLSNTVLPSAFTNYIIMYILFFYSNLNKYI